MSALWLMYATALQKQGHMLSQMCYSCTVWQWSQPQWEEEQQTDIPFTPVYKKQVGRLHSSKQIEETATQFFTLFNHSTRSTSGKWTYKGGKRVDNHQSLLVPVRFSIQSVWWDLFHCQPDLKWCDLLRSSKVKGFVSTSIFRTWTCINMCEVFFFHFN